MPKRQSIKQKSKRRERRAERRKLRSKKPRLEPPPDRFPDRPAVFDTTIPDHFALATALEYLERRYARVGAHLPEACAEEMRRGAATNPRLHDALGASWLRRDPTLDRDDVIAIEQMREDSFGETDPLKGLGECAAIHIARKTGFRLGMEDRVGRKIARRLQVDQFTALQSVRAMYRYCAVSAAEAWNLYVLLRDGVGSAGSKLLSIGRLTRRDFDVYCDKADEDFA